MSERWTNPAGSIGFSGEQLESMDEIPQVSGKTERETGRKKAGEER
jgi:hypothetical protein